MLLSPSPSPTEMDPVYEIVLGAGRNTFSDIRRRRRSNTKASAYTKDVLSGVELREFWVRITNEGMIQVGKEGDDMPLLHWQDPEPLFIQYFSFCTWSGVAGKWLYDCYSDDGKGSVEVEPEMTQVEKLRKRVLRNYDVYSKPVYNMSEPIEIGIKIEAYHVHIDTKNSLMNVGCKFSLEWTDEKISWDPEHFDSLGTLHLNHHEIWQPQLYHLNGVRVGEVGELGRAGTRVTSDGRVRWAPHGTLAARCPLDLRRWPWDVQTCSLRLGFLDQRDSTRLIMVENGTQLNLQQFSYEWKVMKLEAESVAIKLPLLVDVESNAYISDDDDDDITTAPSALTFTFTLKRINSGYIYVLYIPLTVLMIMSLSCCCLDATSKDQLGLNCLLIFLLCGFLLNLSYILPAPVEHIPYLFKAYTTVLVVVTSVTVMTVFIRSFISIPGHGQPPRMVTAALKTEFVRSIFCLPKFEMEHSGGRDSLLLANEDQDNNGLNGSAPSHGPSFTWVLLTTFCHRLAFIITLFTYTAVLLW